MHRLHAATRTTQHLYRDEVKKRNINFYTSIQPPPSPPQQQHNEISFSEKAEKFPYLSIQFNVNMHSFDFQSVIFCLLSHASRHPLRTLFAFFAT